MCAMSEKDIQELANTYPGSPDDLVHDLINPDELARIYQDLTDSPPLYADPLLDNVTAAEKPSYLMHLQRATGLPLPIALEAPPSPLLRRKKFVKTSRHNFKCKIKLCTMKQHYSINDLLLHYAQIHPDVETFNCDVCREPYLIIDSLRVHLKRKHNLSFSRNNFLNQLSANK